MVYFSFLENLRRSNKKVIPLCFELNVAFNSYSKNLYLFNFKCSFKNYISFLLDMKPELLLRSYVELSVYPSLKLHWTNSYWSFQFEVFKIKSRKCRVISSWDFSIGTSLFVWSEKLIWDQNKNVFVIRDKIFFFSSISDRWGVQLLELFFHFVRRKKAVKHITVILFYDLDSDYWFSIFWYTKLLCFFTSIRSYLCTAVVHKWRQDYFSVLDSYHLT